MRTIEKLRVLLNEINSSPMAALQAREGAFGKVGALHIYIGPDEKRVRAFIQAEIPKPDPDSVSHVEWERVIELAERGGAEDQLLPLVMELLNGGEDVYDFGHRFRRAVTKAQIKEGLF